jgi:hypothetical protein
MVLIFAALAGLAYLGFKYLVRGAPQPHMSNIVTLPGAAISKLTFHGNFGMLAIVLGGAVLVLLIAYAAMSSNK